MDGGTRGSGAHTVVLRAVGDGEVASLHVTASSTAGAVLAALEAYWWVDEDPDGGEDTPSFDEGVARGRYKVVAVFAGHLTDLAGGEIVERGDRPPTVGDARAAASRRRAREGA